MIIFHDDSRVTDEFEGGEIIKKVIDVKKVSKYFGSIRALNHISFGVKKGEILGYVGPNGAGKTTTIRILCGLLRPDKGQVKLFEIDPYPDGYQSSEMRKKIGVILENPEHFVHMSAHKNLRYYAEIYQINNAKERIKNNLKAVGLWDRRADLVETFSKGMKQKLAIARVLLLDPDLFIFDEPTSGLDPTAQIEIREVLLNLLSEGKTIFLSSHNLAEVEKICTRVGVINKGKLVFLGKPRQFKRKYKNLENFYLSVVGK